MNQRLDHEIKRALDELVQCAPSPPTGPGALPRPLRTTRTPRVTRIVALAAVVLVMVAGGLALSSQRSTPDSLRTAGTVDTSGGTASISPAPSIAPTTTVAQPTTMQSDAPITTQPDTPTTTQPTIAGPIGEYEIVVPTTMPGTTGSPDGPVDRFDGGYFAFLHEGPLPEEPGSIRFDLVQAFSGEDCIVRFGAAAAQTCTPIGTALDGPTARVDVATDAVAVTIRGANSELTYRVSGAELLRLVNGQPPAAGAPVDFAFTGGPFLLTFDQGTVIRIDQPS